MTKISKINHKLEMTLRRERQRTRTVGATRNANPPRPPRPWGYKLWEIGPIGANHFLTLHFTKGFRRNRIQGDNL